MRICFYVSVYRVILRENSVATCGYVLSFPSPSVPPFLFHHHEITFGGTEIHKWQNKHRFLSFSKWNAQTQMYILWLYNNTYTQHNTQQLYIPTEWGSDFCRFSVLLHNCQDGISWNLQILWMSSTANLHNFLFFPRTRRVKSSSRITY